MIYTVECSFTDPTAEDGWNVFYSDEKLPALISVRGFLTSQRFKLSEGTRSAPTCLAVHTIASEEILESIDYRQNGGGNFARWQPMITNWHRNIYGGVDLFLNVTNDQGLLISNESGDTLRALGFQVLHLCAIGLDRTPMERWMAISGNLADSVHLLSDDGVCIYVPMGSQLQSYSI
ncbi:hypothetical protein [Acidithiobacillus sp.]|uniref:hypothetical protein n=1 Tax=Acidithiobacillus sp. TaxID=1872118 RepID=UPI0025C42E9F|nr:hypothetical protein [Acidithiobacillus sp.]